MPHKPTIVIDPGHGGKDPGATGGGLHESDLALGYALMLGHFLREKGYTTRFTRSSDVNVPLGKRGRAASAGDVFVSCHINGAGSALAHGQSIWYHGGIVESKELANSIFGEINELGLLSRYGSGVIRDTSRYANGFAVLRHAALNGCTRCVLCEPGFISNDGDRKVLSVERNRNLIAQAICMGIDAYLHRE